MRAPTAVTESAVIEACGERSLPETGVIEQRWETDPIPEGELADRAAAAVGAGSRGIRNLSTIGVVPPRKARVVRIEDTMRPKRVHVSAPLLEEARERDDLSVVEEAAPLAFEDGDSADGDRTCAERHGLDTFALTRVGPSM